MFAGRLDRTRKINFVQMILQQKVAQDFAMSEFSLILVLQKENKQSFDR